MRCAASCIVFALATNAWAADEHVPPDPPQSRVHAMAYDEMAEMMGMDDRARFGKLTLNKFEWQDAEESTLAWDATAWYGSDTNKLWLEAEGARAGGGTDESRVEALWDRIATRWWSTRLGVRQDAGAGPSRSWAAFGVAGLAPGFVEMELTAYLGESGRSALRFKADYDLRITQKLVLQPEFELDAYGRDDAARIIGAGISEVEVGLRLRYELRRELAVYTGSSWRTRVGKSAELARAADEAPDDLAWVVGLRAWL